MKWLATCCGLGSRRRSKRGKDAGEGEDAFRNIETGMEMEERSVLWKINNFPVIQKKDSLINLQTFEFSAGATIGQPSRWTVYLRAKEKNEGDENKSIGIYFVVSDPSPGTPGVHLYSQMSFVIKDTAGAATWSRNTQIHNISEISSGGWGYENMITGSVPPEVLEIHVTLKLYSPARKPQDTVPSTLVKFHEKGAAKARKDFGGLVKNPIPGRGGVNIISGDGKEFSASIWILSARSPVFEAMLRTNMVEAASGRIHLPDISGKGLEVLLNFIYTGELPPNWRDSGVIVELTNAAAKYQLTDLLEFLDMALGKVCDVKNVGPLLSLAYQLSLKTAQEELLKFIKDKGASSVEKFSQIMKIISVSAVESVQK